MGENGLRLIIISDVSGHIPLDAHKSMDVCSKTGNEKGSRVDDVAVLQVYDLYSSETMSLAASNAAEWVRGVVSRDDARVLLLQTPALQALHTTRLADDAGPPRREYLYSVSRSVQTAGMCGLGRVNNNTH
jgi:hypothetical protein